MLYEGGGVGTGHGMRDCIRNRDARVCRCVVRVGGLETGMRGWIKICIDRGQLMMLLKKCHTKRSIASVGQPHAPQASAIDRYTISSGTS